MDVRPVATAQAAYEDAAASGVLHQMRQASTSASASVPHSGSAQGGTPLRKQTGRRAFGLQEDGSQTRTIHRGPKGQCCGKALSRVRSAVRGCCTIAHHTGRLKPQRSYLAHLLTVVLRHLRKGSDEPFDSRNVIRPAASCDETARPVAGARHWNHCWTGSLRAAVGPPKCRNARPRLDVGAGAQLPA